MIYVWLRATLAWSDEAAFRAQLEPAFAPKVEAWNATFDMPYHLFRHEVRTIAASNLAEIRDARVRTWDEIPAGALVLPVDDDDWFAPDVARIVGRALDESAAGCRWPSTFLEVPIDLAHRLGLWRRALFPDTPPRWICTTNNYALVKSAETTDPLARHTQASRWAEGPGASRMRRLDARLSVMNRTLASQTSLAFTRPSIRRRELIAKYRAYRVLYRREPRPDVAWCRPYVEAMAQLMRRLTLRG